MKKLQRIEKIKVNKNSELTIFKNNEFGKLTVLEKDGEAWFIAKEIADILEYSGTNKMTKRLDKDEKANTPLRNVSSNQYRNQTVINESGLYEAIFGSKMPKAKAFKKWIKTEVLPTIRKTGSYSIQPRTKLELLEAYYKAEKKAITLEEKIKNDKPLVEFAEQVSNSNDAIDFETFAKLVKDQHLGIGRNRLYKWMRTQKYIMDNNLPYQNMLEKGFFNVIETTYNTLFGVRLSKRVMITPLGQIYFCNRLKEKYK